MKGGEAYELTGAGPWPLLGDERPVRIEVYRAGRDAAEVYCIGRDGWKRRVLHPLRDGHAPAGWRLAGLETPRYRGHDGREVWRIPGPPWGGTLAWAGPGHPLIQHAEGERPGWRGLPVGPVTGPCGDMAEAQATADAWWLAEVVAHVTCGDSNGQASLFGALA